MKSRLLVVLGVCILGACSGPVKEEEKSSGKNPAEMTGSWKTVWTTLPESFEGIPNITSFEMDGKFIFTRDSVTIIANGFPGCVFGVDTLAHTQGWKVGGDTLYLISEGNVHGITYQIKSRNEDQIELQLMEDIFLNLEKVSL